MSVACRRQPPVLHVALLALHIGIQLIAIMSACSVALCCQGKGEVGKLFSAAAAGLPQISLSGVAMLEEDLAASFPESGASSDAGAQQLGCSQQPPSLGALASSQTLHDAWQSAQRTAGPEAQQLALDLEAWKNISSRLLARPDEVGPELRAALGAVFANTIINILLRLDILVGIKVLNVEFLAILFCPAFYLNPSNNIFGIKDFLNFITL